MAVNKVNYGDETLIDLTNDTLTANDLVEGATAHTADGEAVVGKLKVSDVYFGDEQPSDPEKNMFWVDTDEEDCSGGGGNISSGEIVDILTLARGTFVANNTDALYIDTGITLEDLRNYKSFGISFYGDSYKDISNVYVYADVKNHRNMLRAGIASWTIVYEWIDKEKRYLRIYVEHHGNPSMNPAKDIFSTYGLNTDIASLQGAKGRLINICDTLNQSGSLIIYSSNIPTINYNWNIFGITKEA